MYYGRKSDDYLICLKLARWIWLERISTKARAHTSNTDIIPQSSGNVCFIFTLRHSSSFSFLFFVSIWVKDDNICKCDQIWHHFIYGHVLNVQTDPFSIGIDHILCSLLLYLGWFYYYCIITAYVHTNDVYDAIINAKWDGTHAWFALKRFIRCRIHCIFMEFMAAQ